MAKPRVDLWVDATYHQVRVDGRVISQATVVAVGITSEGARQVLGVDVGPSEDRIGAPEFPPLDGTLPDWLEGEREIGVSRRRPSNVITRRV